MTKEKNKDWAKNIVIFLLLFLSVYFVTSISNSRKAYKDEINLLELTKDSLKREIREQYVPRDSILYYLHLQEDYNRIIEGLNTDIQELKNRYNEREIIDVTTLSIDDNIKLFTRLLSEED